MITVGHLTLNDLAELRATWTRDGDKYTSPDGNCTVWIVGEETKIGPYAKIGQGAEIGPNYKLPIQPLWFHGPRYPIGYHSPGMVASGCMLREIGWWEKNIEDLAKQHGYSPNEIKEYRFRVDTLDAWMKLWGVYEVPAPTEAKAEAM